MGKPTYWEQLRHPNWQKKRLEVMERDGFKCVNCRSTEKTLNVHHTYYEKGHAPWEYPTESLKTLCEDCHALNHDVMKNINRQVGSLPDTGYLMQAYGYTSGMEAILNPDVVVSILTHDFLCGLAHAVGVHHQRIAASVIDGQIDGHKLIEILVEKIKEDFG